MISRRQFLTYAAIGAGVIAVPELLLPKRTFFLPPKGGWRGWYLTVDTASKEDEAAFQYFSFDDNREVWLYPSGDETGKRDPKNYAAAHKAARLAHPKRSYVYVRHVRLAKGRYYFGDITIVDGKLA